MKLLRKLIIPSSFYLRFLSLVTVILFISITKSFASQITLMWDASTENDIAGYKIFYGNSSGNYNSIIDVSNQTSYTISDLVDGNTYYIALTAYDVRGNESGFSKEISDVASTSCNNSPVLSYVADKMIRQTKNSWSGPVYATMHSRFVHRTDCEKLISNTERKTITGEIVKITENLIIFPSIGQALRDGGVPCSICNP